MKGPVKIIRQEEKRLIGKHLRMSLQNNLTRELWSSFMPVRNQIERPLSQNLYSVQVYDDEIAFSAEKEFTKWACMEVEFGMNIPAGMEELIIPTGEYAVFVHKGPAHTFPKTMNLAMEWMTESGKSFDHRPQYEVLPPDYPGPMSPDAEEEVWIPIK